MIEYGSREYLALLAKADGEANGAEPFPDAMCAFDVPPQPPVTWLIDDVWPDAEIGLFAGDGGAFKSSVALHIACAVAGGYPVFERHRVREARPVLILSEEDDLPILMMKLEAFIAGHGWDREAVLRNVHLIAMEGISLGSVRWHHHVIKQCERVRPGFVLLDPWFEFVDGEENSNSDARPVIKFLRKLAKTFFCGVGIVHHAGKQSNGGGEQRRTLDRIRGASALPSASRVVLFFEAREDGIYVENVKLSRAERLAPFLIRCDVQHVAGNRAQWTAARLTTQAALPVAETWIVTYLRSTFKHERGPTSTDLRDLGGAQKAIKAVDIDAARKRLAAMGVIVWEKGRGPTKHWRLSDPNYRPPQRELSLVGQDAQHVGTREPSQKRQDVSDVPKHLSSEMSPLKGGHLNHGSKMYKAQSATDPWADRDFIPSDLEAEDDERGGMQEG